MPEKLADIQKRQIEAAQFKLNSAMSIQGMRIKAVEADMKVAMEKAEIAKKWIEVETDQLKLTRLYKAYREYDRQVLKLKQKSQSITRDAEMMERFINRAGMFFNGERVPVSQRYIVLSAITWLFRKLFIRATNSIIVLNKHITEKTMPLVGSDDYNLVLDGIAEIQEVVQLEQVKFEARIAVAENTLKELQNAEWSKAGII